MRRLTQTLTPLLKRVADQWPQLLTEMFSVVLAVLLALAVNQWREDQARIALAEEALVKVTHEVTDNRRRLQETLEEQKAQLEQLRTKIEELAETPDQEGFSINLTAESLRDTSWQTTLVTGAVRSMSFETIAILSDVYRLQGLVDRAVERMLDSMTSPDFFRDEMDMVAIRHMTANLNQVIELEVQLIERYDEFLDNR